MKYKVGDKIKFSGEKQRYTIQACNNRFLICTKPFNAMKTYLYTIVDLEAQIRGPWNNVLGLLGDVHTPKKAQKFLENYIKSSHDISYRNRIKLNIDLT